MGIRASSELRAAKEAGSCVGGSLRGRNPRGRETEKGGKEEMVEGGGRVVRRGKVPGVCMEPIASERRLIDSVMFRCWAKTDIKERLGGAED